MRLSPQQARPQRLLPLDSFVEQYRVLAESIPQIVWISDEAGFVEYFNRNWSEHTGLPLEESLGQGWIAALCPDDRERALSRWRQAVGTGNAYEVEHRLRQPQGGYRWYLARGTPVRNGAGRIVKWFGTCTDIDQQKRGEQESSFLVNASKILASSLDYQTTLDALARLVVPEIADYCVIEILEDGTNLRQVAIAHVDPAKEKIARDLYRRYPCDPCAPSGAMKVVRTGESEVVREITSQWREAVKQDEEHLALLDRLEPKSCLIVPLVTPVRTIGAISLFLSESGRRFGERDLRVARELAYRAALAIDHALIYREAQAEIERGKFQACLLDVVEQAVIAIDMDGSITYWNRYAEKLYGWAAAEVLGKNIMTEIMPSQSRQVARVMERLFRGESWSGELMMHRHNGESFMAMMGATPIRDEHGRPIGVVGVSADVTARKKMEDHLIKAQKLESIGVLAGGIAHDFNNILTAILGNIALAKMCARDGGDIGMVLDEAEKAFGRARDLTQQLLTFAKGGAPVREVGALQRVLQEASRFALTGSNVRCETDVRDDLWAVSFDAGQISQVINNLVINAKQAMPDGGLITIRAENVVLGEGQVMALAPGRYVRTSVSDRGLGIPRENLLRIFDPYFTTKKKGTGLGLATSYSIVKKHDGHIEVESQPGLGSTFIVYLPAVNDAPPDEAPEAALALTGKGKGKVLLMDDEETLRQVGGRLLAGLGYEVSFAKDGGEAIRLYIEAQWTGRPFIAVILDLTVPDGMGGKECLKKLRAIDPDIKAIVSSGYVNDPVMRQYRKFGFGGAVAKPYRLQDLIETLHSLAPPE